MTHRPINCIAVLCDIRRLQRIAITCRCGKRWTEVVPQELHDSDMTIQFECIACGTFYHLYQKQLQRITKEDTHDPGQQTYNIPIPDPDKQHYDS